MVDCEKAAWKIKINYQSGHLSNLQESKKNHLESTFRSSLGSKNDDGVMCFRPLTNFIPAQNKRLIFCPLILIYFSQKRYTLCLRVGYLSSSVRIPAVIRLSQGLESCPKHTGQR